ncbi:hypothetical protein [Oceanobacillus oncorhynchi]|uniref:hypothetical protein n=1 Tax=Oceanobacillus oncorhynchi TaxID=545501 RepID=UPI0034D3C3CF
MNIGELEMQKKFDEGFKEGISQGINQGVNSVKQRIFKQLVGAIKENMSQYAIGVIIKTGDFSQEEIDEAYRKARE